MLAKTQQFFFFEQTIELWLETLALLPKNYDYYIGIDSCQSSIVNIHKQITNHMMLNKISNCLSNTRRNKIRSESQKYLTPHGLLFLFSYRIFISKSPVQLQNTIQTPSCQVNVKSKKKNLKFSRNHFIDDINSFAEIRGLESCGEH